MQGMQKTWVGSLGWKDPLEEEVTTRSRIFLQAKFQGQKSLAGYSQWGPKELDTTDQKHTYEQAYHVPFPAFKKCLLNSFTHLFLPCHVPKRCEVTPFHL